MTGTTDRAAPQLTLSFPIQGRNFKGSGEASSRIKRTLEHIGLDWAVVRRAAIVLYEAEMNIVIHARHGVLTAEITPSRIVITADDEGPGIADVSLAMTEGYSTASDEIREMGFGAGMGLPNIRRNSDSLEIDTVVGRGTRLVAVILVRGGQAWPEAGAGDNGRAATGGNRG